MSRRQRRKEAAEVARKAGGKLSVGASLRKLDRIKHEIPFYPLELMAEYVDGVVSKTPNDFLLHAPVMDELREMSDLELYKISNSTAFGNAAFLYLNSEVEVIKNGAKEFIDRVRSYIEFIGKAPELDEDGFYNPKK